MHVSPDNVIRFPVLAPAMAPRVETPGAAGQADESAKILAFKPVENPVFDERSQEHGQLFVAHRIISRVADGLDNVTTL